MTLDKLPLGHSAVIVSVGGDGALRRRFLDMGLTPKTRVFMKKIAPLGDPLGLCIRGYELTIRKADAGKIEIRETGEKDGPGCGESVSFLRGRCDGGCCGGQAGR